MDKRLEHLKQWLLNDLKLDLKSIKPASADASFRRYFRAETQTGVFVIMDAPPEHETVDEFVTIAAALIKQGVHAPQVFEKNQEQGFLLLEDLGNRLILDELSEQRDQPQQIDGIYQKAISALIKLQKGYSDQAELELPSYDTDKLDSEMDLFQDWFAIKHLGDTLTEQQHRIWTQTKQWLINAFAEQPRVWVHRDFHSRNLMLNGPDSLGVIDFQDMVVGAIGYDLASIFKDCYIRWPRSTQHAWLENYRQYAKQELDLNIEQAELVRWVDLCGLQRHLKVLGIFCRLNYRDGKADYLNDLPLVAQYVLEVLPLYPELAEFEAEFSGLIEQAL